MTYSFYANDTWRVNNRLTFTPGLRFDRFRNSLPEQEHPAGRFSDTPITFAAVNDLVSWNLFGPRIGVTYDLSGSGRTVLKFNYGQYWWNPSNDISSAANPNRSPWFRRYQWTDRNGNGSWDEGEQGTLISSQGGVASTVVDPNLEDTYTRELSAWFERELAANFGMRTGLVVRQIRNQRVTLQRQSSVQRLQRAGARFPIPVRTACAAMPTTARHSAGSTSIRRCSVCRR